MNLEMPVLLMSKSGDQQVFVTQHSLRVSRERENFDSSATERNRSRYGRF